MPKMKTDRGAAKRFKITGHGQDPPPPGQPVAPAREEVVSAGPGGSGARPTSSAADRREVRRLLGR